MNDNNNSNKNNSNKNNNNNGEMFITLHEDARFTLEKLEIGNSNQQFVLIESEIDQSEDYINVIN